MEQLSQQRNESTSLAVERSRLTGEAMTDVDAARVIDHQAVQEWADSLDTQLSSLEQDKRLRQEQSRAAVASGAKALSENFFIPKEIAPGVRMVVAPIGLVNLGALTGA